MLMRSYHYKWYNMKNGNNVVAQVCHVFTLYIKRMLKGNNRRPSTGNRANNAIILMYVIEISIFGKSP